MSQTCSRCGESAERPIESSMNYVKSSDFAEEEPVEVHYAMVHTDETWAEVERLDKIIEEKDKQQLAAEASREGAPPSIEYVTGTKRVENDDGSIIETAEKERVEFSIPEEDFDHVEVDTPDVVKENDDIASTYTEIEERSVDKTGLVCPGCTKDDDDLIWGPDA